MKKILLLSALLTGITCLAQNATLAAKPLQYTFTLPAIEALPFDVKPFGASDKPGCEITYLVIGNGLTDIDRDSIQIDAIATKDGKDLSKDNRGRASWKLSGFTKVSDDGKYATFSIFVATENPMTIPTIKGSITAKSAGKTETKTLTFKAADKGVEQKAGPFTFAISKEDDFGILMKGDRGLVTELTINAGGKVIKKQGYFGSPTTTAYQFADTPTTPEFTLSVTYFTDQQNLKVTIGQ